MGMKTAISIPDDVFAEADLLAKRSDLTRSELYSRAVREYVARHSPDRVTEALDRVVDLVGPDNDFAVEAGRRILEDTEW